MLWTKLCLIGSTRIFFFQTVGPGAFCGVWSGSTVFRMDIKHTALTHVGIVAWKPVFGVCDIQYRVSSTLEYPRSTLLNIWQTNI